MKVTNNRSEPEAGKVTRKRSEPKEGLIMTEFTNTIEGPIPHYKLYRKGYLIAELPVKVRSSKRGVRPVRVDHRLIYVLPGGVDFDPAVDWLK